jgi:hypothetical protein
MPQAQSIAWGKPALPSKYQNAEHPLSSISAVSATFISATISDHGYGITMFDPHAIKKFRGENFEYTTSRGGSPYPSTAATLPTINLPLRPSFPSQTLRTPMASRSNVPKPGPAKLTTRSGLDEWLSEAKQCKYLPEWAMKQLCEMVKECLMEGEIFVRAPVV